MHNHAPGDLSRFEELQVGRTLGPLEITITDEANRRFWTAAGIEHRAADGVLYPPIGAQFAIMLTRAAIAPAEVLHAGQTLRFHRRAHAGERLVSMATVTNRYEKRGRAYVEVESETRLVADGELVWTGTATFAAMR